MTTTATIETHPAYGMIGIYRTSGGGKRQLFGSALADHQHTIHIRVTRGERHHDLGRDWYYGGAKEIFDVELSAAQFAEFITTPNVGSGVPCTIRTLAGERVPPPPAVEIEVERVQAAFRQDMHNLAAKMAAATTQVTTLLEKKTLANKDREEIRKALASMVQDVAANFPFMLQQFEEATQKITSAAKAEVEAFMTNAVHQVGLATIQERGLAALPEPKVQP